MDDKEIIMTIGVLKGMQSQIKDPDIRSALECSIDIMEKLLFGYVLTEPRTTKIASTLNFESKGE